MQKTSNQQSTSKFDSSQLMAELEEALAIDEHALEDGLRSQPDLFYKVAKRLALLISRRDEAKKRLQEIEAERELELREMVAKEGDKITVAEIAASIRVTPEYKNQLAVVMQLDQQVNTWSALKEAFQQRSYALKELVGLYVSNYFGASSDNATTRSLRDAAAQGYHEERRNRSRS